MIRTEEEAAKCRCPLSFAAMPNVSDQGGVISYVAGVSPGVPTAPTFCIGSKCMAWRVWGRAFDGAPGTLVWKEVMPDGSIQDRYEGPPLPPRAAMGFCGMVSNGPVMEPVADIVTDSVTEPPR